MIAILACIFCSCQTVVFTAPQPARLPAENSFPQDWQGIFKSIPSPGERTSDNTWIKISDNQLFLFNSRIDSVPFLEGDYESGEIPEIGDSVKVMLRGQLISALFIEDDWARFAVQKIDTLGLSDSLIFKLVDDWAVLNIPDEQQGKKYWNSIVIEPLRNGDLLVWTIEDAEFEEEFMNQFFIVETIEDPGYAGKLYAATPKRKEFIEYVTRGGFPDLFMWLSQTYSPEEIPQSLK